MLDFISLRNLIQISILLEVSNIRNIKKKNSKNLKWLWKQYLHMFIHF